VVAVLVDALHRVAVLGGREGMPRSLGSVYGGCVTRFLGGSLRGVVSRVINPRRRVKPMKFQYTTKSQCNGVAVSRDGCTLLLSVGDISGCPSAIHELGVADGSRRRVIGGEGDGPLEFDVPHQVCVAPDGFVFVAEYGNSRVQVLTPSLDFHCTIGEGRLEYPAGVCANADVVVVSEMHAHGIAVFNRGDGALLRRFGCGGSGDGELVRPYALCFMSGDRHVAVADADNHRVSVFSIDGEFIRHVGAGVLSHALGVDGVVGVAASPFDELVVADPDNSCLRVFSATGDLLATVGDRLGSVRSIAVFDGKVFAVGDSASTVTVFE
jgi:DNA-binding beta-propeller fold protein YncE